MISNLKLLNLTEPRSQELGSGAVRTVQHVVIRDVLLYYVFDPEFYLIPLS